MMGLYGTAGYFTYRALDQKISYEQGLLTFIPLFIAAYWFSTFFGQLIFPKNGDLLIPRKIYNILYWVSTVTALGLIGVWGYIVIAKKLYLSL